MIVWVKGTEIVGYFIRHQPFKLLSIWRSKIRRSFQSNRNMILGLGCGEFSSCSFLPKEVVMVRDHLYLLPLLNMLLCASPWGQEKRTTDMLQDNLLTGTLKTGSPAHSLWEPSCSRPTALPSPLLWLEHSCLLIICFPGYWWYSGTILVVSDRNVIKLD